jgi:HD-GYP domain-containing protein (c-di-GMP phosphodiesterase class II)
LAVTSLIINGKKLVPIDVVRDFIDETGKAKSDFFNTSGAILVKAGAVVPDKIFRMPVYTYVSAYTAFSKLPEIPQTQPEAETLQESVDQKTNRLIQEFGESTVTTVKETSRQVEAILDKSADALNSYTTAKNIVERTYDLNHIILHRCIKALRTADTYTYNHSFSVYLLFVQVMEDFKKYINRDEFWNLFKESYNKVSFNTENIKLYGVGALLHDIGIAFLPPNILKKVEKLDEEEKSIIKTHPRLGVTALEKAGILNPQVLEIVGNHHARYLAFKERGQSALTMIANIVDIYDACRSERSYRPSFSFARTLEILEIEKRDLNWNPFLYNIIIKETLPKFEKF